MLILKSKLGKELNREVLRFTIVDEDRKGERCKRLKRKALLMKSEPSKD